MRRTRRPGPPAAVLLAFVALPAAARAQLPVLDESGSTTVEFRSDTGEPQNISLYTEGEDESWDHQPMCETPCALRLPSGTHELMAGAHRTFTIVADGGTQAWRVEDNNLQGIIAGAVLTRLGPLLPPLFLVGRFFHLLFGGWWACQGDGCEFFSDEMNTALIVAGSLGGAMLLVGLPVWLSSYGSAERFDPATAATLGLPARPAPGPRPVRLRKPLGSPQPGPEPRAALLGPRAPVGRTSSAGGWARRAPHRFTGRRRPDLSRRPKAGFEAPRHH